MKIERIPTELEPYRVSISFTMSADGSGEYHVVTMANTGSRPKDENWGYATPACGHLACRWHNLGQAAHDWADIAVPAQGVAAWHPEQLGLASPRP